MSEHEETWTWSTGGVTFLYLPLLDQTTMMTPRERLPRCLVAVDKILWVRPHGSYAKIRVGDGTVAADNDLEVALTVEEIYDAMAAKK